MVATIVLIFVVEYLPGNVLNKSLESAVNIFEMKKIEANVEKCDFRIADPILQTVSREKDLIVVPEYKVNQEVEEKKKDVSSTITISDENTKEIEHNIARVLESSFDSANTSRELTKFIGDKSFEHDIFEDKSECENKSSEHHFDATRKISIKVSYPTLAPFLVAIFESVEDVTAQTCGGAVVAPEWVLTAASCIGLLHNLYTNQTSEIVMEKSQYTVIANTSNPFSEGTAHGVTEIHLHPEQKLVPDGGIVTKSCSGLKKHLNKTDTKWRAISPTLAMMRVNPPIEVDLVDMVASTLPPKTDVMVYGWMLKKNFSEEEHLRQTSFAAKTLTLRECKIMQNLSTAMVCFFHEGNAPIREESSKVWMSSGGPVLALDQGVVKMLGIANTEQNLPSSAFAIADHAHWINKLIFS